MYLSKKLSGFISEQHELLRRRIILRSISRQLDDEAVELSDEERQEIQDAMDMLQSRFKTAHEETTGRVAKSPEEKTYSELEIDRIERGAKMKRCKITPVQKKIAEDKHREVMHDEAMLDKYLDDLQAANLGSFGSRPATQRPIFFSSAEIPPIYQLLAATAPIHPDDTSRSAPNITRKFQNAVLSYRNDMPDKVKQALRMDDKKFAESLFYNVVIPNLGHGHCYYNPIPSVDGRAICEQLRFTRHSSAVAEAIPDYPYSLIYLHLINVGIANTSAKIIVDAIRTNYHLPAGSEFAIFCGEEEGGEVYRLLSDGYVFNVDKDPVVNKGNTNFAHDICERIPERNFMMPLLRALSMLELHVTYCPPKEVRNVTPNM